MLNSIAGLLRHNANYRCLWLAFAGSQFGDWFNQVALAQITLMMTHSAAALGGVLLCRSLPGIALGPFVGPFVDRTHKKFILVASDAFRALFALGYAVAWITHSAWMLYVFSVVLGICGVLFGPARSAVLPLLVPRSQLMQANASTSAVSGVIQIFGAIAGGVTATLLTPTLCFVLNACSYAWSALWVMRAEWQEQKRGIPYGPYTKSLRDGLQAVSTNQVARSIVWIGISWGLAGGAYYLLVPVLGTTLWTAGDYGVGVLYAVDGLGVLIGAWSVHRWVGHQPHRAITWYGLAYITQGVLFACLAQCSAFGLAALSLLCMRISSGVIIPLDTSLLQSYTSAENRGRVFALHGSTYGGVMQLSYLLMGWLFATVGTKLTGIAVGMVSLLCGWYWFRVARSRAKLAST